MLLSEERKQDPNAIDFSVVLVDAKGKPYRQSQRNEEDNTVNQVDLTLGMACTTSLGGGAFAQSLEKVEYQTKHKIGKLIDAIYSTDHPFALTDSQKSHIKKALGLTYLPQIVGPAVNLIEGRSQRNYGPSE